ncbi:synaptopodin 2-like protein [Brachyhypopomus gauderio]|uniref:synaptopodin 2-like protein n=1 Tax=Brachyhypopomus gauderio TaxID=698409 RepID=UPI00404304CB
MVVEEVIITLSGGAPWGFRLQGGVEQQRPLQVAKVRKRSKACRAGLREGDELVAINESPCASLSHAQAMHLIDSIPGALRIRVKRAPAGFQSVVLVARAPSPRIDKEYRAGLRAKSPSGTRAQQASVRQVQHGSPGAPPGRSGLTSPPGSEAYYGETDSDADVSAHDRQRRAKRRSPSNSLGKAGRTSPEGGETSEMSGYDSAPDAQAYTATEPGDAREQDDTPAGVARREVVYQPCPPGTWSSHTSIETSSVSTDNHSAQNVLMEEDDGFQDTANVPLVSPERAKEARMLTSRSQLVPMVGPVDNPVDEELTLTYMAKAKQAKLNRGETQQDKQVKEARTKCRTIASLLTDAPNPHSKGVLMFKKRRQRSKKYTLTSYGSVDEDMNPDSQEEDGLLPGSESEFDEEGFSAAPDPTWDSDYLDMLERRSASRGMEEERATCLSPGLSDSSGKGAQLFEQQRKRAEEHAKKTAAAQAQHAHVWSQSHAEVQTQAPPPSVQAENKPGVQPPPVAPKPARPPALMLQQDTTATEMLTSAPALIPPPSLIPTHSLISALPHQGSPSAVREDIATVEAPDEVAINKLLSLPSSGVMPPPPTPLPELPPSSVLNRTARPFAPGFITHRASTAPVVFRPSVAKKSPRPVSVAVMAPPVSAPSEEMIIGVVPAGIVGSQRITAPTAQPSTLAYVPPKLHPPAPPGPLPPVPAQQTALHVSSAMDNNQETNSTPQVTALTDSLMPAAVITSAPPAGLPDHISVRSAAPAGPTAPMAVSAPVTPSSSVAPLSPVVYREKASGAGSRTGILEEARRRNTQKPMFKILDGKKNSPNPELLSMVQNLDERPKHAYFDPTVFYEDDSFGVEEKGGRMPPPVAPKPRITPETSLISQTEGKGAELFARRQNRMDFYVVDSVHRAPQQLYTLPQQPQSVMAMIGPQEPSPAHWKYSPNVRAPPPIGYNPLLSPSCPLGVQRGGTRGSQEGPKVGKSGYGMQKEGIKAIDFMRRQPYQLNPAMFSFTGSSNAHSHQKLLREGHTLTQPRQVPVKAARVYEIKRFSTPTPMSAPTITPTVIAPRAQTTLGEPLSRADVTSTLPEPASPPPRGEPEPTPARVPGLPELPKILTAPIPHPTPYSPPTPMSSRFNVSYPGLQAAKQFKSAPELSTLPLSSLKPPVQAPKPRFIANRVGIQPHVWRPGAQHH